MNPLRVYVIGGGTVIECPQCGEEIEDGQAVQVDKAGALPPICENCEAPAGYIYGGQAVHLDAVD